LESERPGHTTISRVSTEISESPKFREISRNVSVSFGQTFREISHNFGSFGSIHFPEILVDFGNFGRIRNFGSTEISVVSVVFQEFQELKSTSRNFPCRLSALHWLVTLAQPMRGSNYKFPRVSVSFGKFRSVSLSSVSWNFGQFR
jgi:hypothetical protein